MMNQFLWQQILAEAERWGIPLNKKRAILREFLQVKFLTSLYSFSGCQELAFIGGTALRLLHGLDRFSEDLDFDNFGLKTEKIKELFQKTVRVFKREKYSLQFDFRKRENGGQARLRFPGLLQQLAISSNPKEKLMIRLDFTRQKRFASEVLLLSRFGMSERIVVNALPVLLSQKMRALMTRKQTRGRDFYDLYWLLARAVKPDLAVLKKLKINSEREFFDALKKIYQREKNQMSFYKRQIRPFLLQEEQVRNLDFLASL